MKTLHFLLLIGAHVLVVKTSILTVWNFDAVADSITFETLFKVRTETQLACARNCHLNEKCKSFVFDMSDQICTGYTTQEVANITMITNGQVFYKRKEDFCPVDQGYIYVPTHNYCYSIGNEELTWEPARDVCQSRNGSLISLETVAKKTYFNQLAKEVFQNPWGIWIGGFENGTENWIWMNGSQMPMSRDFWAYAEPNEEFRDEDCAALISDVNGFFDLRCWYNLKFFCEIRYS